MISRRTMVLVFWLLALALPLANLVLLLLSGALPLPIFLVLNYRSIFDILTFVFGTISLFALPAGPFLCLALLGGKRDLEGRLLYGDRSMVILAASSLIGVVVPWFLIWFLGWLFQFTDYVIGIASLFVVAPILAICLIVGGQIGLYADRDYYQ